MDLGQKKQGASQEKSIEEKDTEDEWEEWEREKWEFNLFDILVGLSKLRLAAKSAQDMVTKDLFLCCTTKTLLEHVEAFNKVVETWG